MFMNRKFVMAVFMILALILPSFGAENKEMAADYVTQIQNEISSDLGRLRAAIETELSGISLTSSDVAKRIAVETLTGKVTTRG